MSEQHWPSPLEEARALVVKGDADGALQRLSTVLDGEFFHDEALFMLGGILLSKNMNGLAAVVTSAAIDARQTKKQHFPEALLNLGSCYKAVHNNELAERIWLDALKYETISSARAKIMTNIAGLFINEACPEKAVEWCTRAVVEDPMNWGARVNRGIAYLEMGKWREGWDGFAYTYHTGDRFHREYRVGSNLVSEWLGEGDQTVIVHGDQGVGDEIYFANSLPDMIARCKHVILDCHPRLEHLFRRSFPQTTVYGTRKHLSELPWVRDCGASAAIGLADLPGFFRNLDAEWRGEPYLRAADDPFVGTATDAQQRKAFSRRGSALRVGLSWTGGVKKTRTELRSIPLEQLEPIVRARPDAHFFSLQYTPSAAREVCELEERTGCRISHYPGWVECFDYDRTASFVNSLDLIITVGTTVHHLGGALGVPTWTLVPLRASWRYAVGGERLPWYDSVKVYRQETDGDWSQPIARIADDLPRFHLHSLAAD